MTVPGRPAVQPPAKPIPSLPCGICGKRGLVVRYGHPPYCRYCTPRPEPKRAAA